MPHHATPHLDVVGAILQHLRRVRNRSLEVGELLVARGTIGQTLDGHLVGLKEGRKEGSEGNEVSGSK